MYGGTVDIVCVVKGKNKLTTDIVQAISTALGTVAGSLTGDLRQEPVRRKWGQDGIGD